MSRTNKADEYRANAAECELMASISRHAGEKATWLQMAQHWLRMIRQDNTPTFERFDAAERSQGTGQAPSRAEH
jgi:hypothetical protein